MTPVAVIDPLVIDEKRATVTVTTHDKGWTVVGVSKIRTVNGEPATFTADLPRCDCVRQACATLHRVPEPGKRPYSWAHGEGFCHDWHFDRVRKLAEATAKTYL
ncbi:MAG: hypothetical protein ACRDQA_07480 [Nocardioidaceae bacterium]